MIEPHVPTELPDKRGAHRAPHSCIEDLLPFVKESVRQMSTLTEPQAMVSYFRDRSRRLFGGEGSLSLSRRGLTYPHVRVTRNSRWAHEVDPWQQPHLLPVLEGGQLAELIYAGEPRMISDVTVDPGDPAHEFIGFARSLVALPLFDEGKSLNMVIRLSSEPRHFDNVNLADALLTANLFGRATSSLLLAQKLEKAYAELDFEMRRIADIRRSLLPTNAPNDPRIDVALSYQAAARAGGDYYDFFDLGERRWGILIADVSGHGTPAAVVMAMLRTILHGLCHTCSTPAQLLESANRQLMNQSNRYDSTFVTACYLVLDLNNGSLTYSNAGHNPPLVVDAGANVHELDQAGSLPLGVDRDASYALAETRLVANDTMLLYTDGITEATNEHGEQYGRDRLLCCISKNVPNAQHIIDCVTHRLLAYTGTRDQEDDRTLIAVRML